MNNKKTFYIVGVVCAAALMVTGFVVTNNIKSGVEKIQYEMELKSPSPTPKAIPSAKPASAKNTDIPKETPAAPPVRQVAAKKESKPKFIMPAEGAVSTKFSGDALVYSPTFDDWRTHTGIDIDAEPDTQVKAAADGTVSKIYLDEMMGNTIEIDHGDGLVTKYSNLSTIDLVSEGLSVKAGDIISGIGNTAAAEKSQAPHLHFEAIYKNEAIDPLTEFQSEIVMPGM